MWHTPHAAVRLCWFFIINIIVIISRWMLIWSPTCVGLVLWLISTMTVMDKRHWYKMCQDKHGKHLGSVHRPSCRFAVNEKMALVSHCLMNITNVCDVCVFVQRLQGKHSKLHHSNSTHYSDSCSSTDTYICLPWSKSVPLFSCFIASPHHDLQNPELPQALIWIKPS